MLILEFVLYVMEILLRKDFNVDFAKQLIIWTAQIFCALVIKQTWNLVIS